MIRLFLSECGPGSNLQDNDSKVKFKKPNQYLHCEKDEKVHEKTSWVTAYDWAEKRFGSTFNIVAQT